MDSIFQMAYSLCPHHVSHYLGIDVHDTGTVDRTIPLEPGMVITIEPGNVTHINFRTQSIMGCIV